MPDHLNDFLDGKIAPSKDNSRGEAIRRGAKDLGIDPVDYATVISYESAGSFDPWKAGPTTKWGQHRGTIQYGEPQRQEYGVYEGQPFEDQVTTSNVKYLRDKGVKPGATLLDIYKAINGGSVNASENASDGYDKNGKKNTIIGHVEKMRRDHRPQVIKRFFSNDLDGFLDGGEPMPKDTSVVQSSKNALDSFLDAPVNTANTSLAVGEGANVNTNLATGEIILKNGQPVSPSKPKISVPKLGVPINPTNPATTPPIQPSAETEAKEIAGLPNAQIGQTAFGANHSAQRQSDPSAKFLNEFNTALSPDEEGQFQKWAIGKYGSQGSLDGELGNYDLRGAWRELQSGQIKAAENGHLPDKFKKPNHITFSNESQYAKGDAGEWKQIGGRWHFTPSAQTVELYGADGLKNYFAEQERDAQLNIPATPTPSALPSPSVQSPAAPTSLKAGTSENIADSENNGRSITLDLRNVSGDKNEFINTQTAKQIAAEFDVPEADALAVLNKYPLMHGDGTPFTPDEVAAQETTNFKLTPSLIAEIRQNTEARKAAEFQESENERLQTAQDEAGLRQQAIDDLREEKKDSSLWTTGGIGEYVGDTIGDAIFGDEAKEPTEEEINQRIESIKKSRLSAEDERRARNVGGNLNDYLGEDLGGLVGGVLGSGGRAVKSLAGIARPFTDFGVYGEDVYSELSKIAQYNETAEQSAGGDGAVSKVLKIGGALPGDLSRLGVLSRLPGGAVVGFAADSALQSAGAGESVGEVVKSGIKGAALGATFGIAGKAGKVASDTFGKNALALADAFPSNALYKTVNAAKSIVREGVELGTIAGGTMTIEKLSGSSDEQAAQSAIFNALFHVVGKVQGKALDKILQDLERRQIVKCLR